MLIIMLMLSQIGIVSNAAATPVTFTADMSACATPMPGESILVPIQITNNPGLAGVELVVTLGAGL